MVNLKKEEPHASRAGMFHADQLAMEPELPASGCFGKEHIWEDRKEVSAE